MPRTHDMASGCALAVIGFIAGGVAGLMVSAAVAASITSLATAAFVWVFGTLGGAVLGALCVPLAAKAIRNWGKRRKARSGA